jgi:hypothetical protein
MVSLFFGAFGGRIEGWVLPVVRDTTLTRIAADGVGGSLIWGHTVRQRECVFVRLEWRVGTPAHYAVVDLRSLDGSKVRRGNVFAFGPWKLHATPEQLVHRSFATAVHRCHPLWLTETAFYVSGGPP